MKKTLTLLIGALLSAGLMAQKSDTTVVKRIHEFGIHGGSTTGVGLSYRYWPGKLGMQVTFLPVKTTDQTFISIGVSGLYSFYETRLLRFFGYVGNNLTVDNRRSYDYFDNYNPSTGRYESPSKYVRNTMYNIGFGPGFSFGSRIRVNIQAGYGLYDIFDEFNIYPAGEVGLYFRL